MPLTLPNLDDRTFDDLVAEALALIPALDPQWTDHNPSDPGITLVELFAYISEILIYRLNRVTEANTRAFLKLLDPASEKTQTGDLAADVRRVVQALRRPARAVTPEDFEFLARAASPAVARVACVARRDLGPGGSPTAEARGHVSVVVVPADGGEPTDALLGTVLGALEQARLLTTKLHVVKPSLVKVGVQLSLFLEADALAEDVRARARTALNTWLDPLRGGADGKGWPFGRPVYLSEIYGLLDQLPGVDYVEPTAGIPEFDVADPGLLLYSGRALVAVRLDPGQLVSPNIDPAKLTVVGKGVRQ